MARLNRIHALLTSKTLFKPFRRMQRALVLSLLVIVAVHAVGFALLVDAVGRQSVIVGYLKNAGQQKRMFISTLLYARIIESYAAYRDYPWLTLADARSRLASRGKTISENNELLYEALSKINGHTHRTLYDLWKGNNLVNIVDPW